MFILADEDRYDIVIISYRLQLRKSAIFIVADASEQLLH